MGEAEYRSEWNVFLEIFSTLVHHQVFNRKSEFLPCLSRGSGKGSNRQINGNSLCLKDWEKILSLCHRKHSDHGAWKKAQFELLCDKSICMPLAWKTSNHESWTQDSTWFFGLLEAMDYVRHLVNRKNIKQMVEITLSKVFNRFASW